MSVDIDNFETFIGDGVLACQLVNLVQQDLISIYYPEKDKVSKYSQLRLIEPPVNRFHRLIGSKQPGPEVALLSGVDCINK